MPGIIPQGVRSPEVSPPARKLPETREAKGPGSSGFLQKEQGTDTGCSGVTSRPPKAAYSRARLLPGLLPPLTLDLAPTPSPTPIPVKVMAPWGALQTPVGVRVTERAASRDGHPDWARGLSVEGLGAGPGL